MKGYIGTYTKESSKGIYSVDFSDGKLTQLEEVYRLKNPTYLIAEGDKLYSICETEDKKGRLVIYDKEIKYEISVEGEGYCHLCIDDEKKYIVCSSYRGGHFSVYQFEDGLEFLYNIYPSEVSRCHYASFYKDFLLVADLGFDKLLVYNFDKTTGKASLNENLTYVCEAGSGPRHFTINGEHIYLLHELNSTIKVLNLFDKKIDCIQTIDTLRQANPENACAAIKITKDKKYLYASNRGDDTIVGYRILSDGRLRYISHTSTLGEHPRDFEIVPSDDYLIVANMNTNEVLTFKIDKENGTLGYEFDKIGVSLPVCLKFI